MILLPGWVCDLCVDDDDAIEHAFLVENVTDLVGRADDDIVDRPERRAATVSSRRRRFDPRFEEDEVDSSSEDGDGSDDEPDENNASVSPKSHSAIAVSTTPL